MPLTQYGPRWFTDYSSIWDLGSRVCEEKVQKVVFFFLKFISLKVRFLISAVILMCHSMWDTLMFLSSGASSEINN